MRMSYDNTNTVEFTACNSVQKSKMNVTTIVERNVNGVTGSLSIWLHRRRWLPRGCYPQTAMLFPLHFPRLFSAGGMRLPHTAMLLLLHFDRIALLAALSSQDMSLFLPHDASRPIRLSSPPPPSSGSPSSPYASPGSWNSELRRVLCERAGGRSAAAEEGDSCDDDDSWHDVLVQHALSFRHYSTTSRSDTPQYCMKYLHIKPCTVLAFWSHIQMIGICHKKKTV